jgi:hypothetical protein
MFASIDFQEQVSAVRALFSIDILELRRSFLMLASGFNTIEPDSLVLVGSVVQLIPGQVSANSSISMTLDVVMSFSALYIYILYLLYRSLCSHPNGKYKLK